MSGQDGSSGGQGVHEKEERPGSGGNGRRSPGSYADELRQRAAAQARTRPQQQQPQAGFSSGYGYYHSGTTSPLKQQTGGVYGDDSPQLACPTQAAGNNQPRSYSRSPRNSPRKQFLPAVPEDITTAFQLMGQGNERLAGILERGVRMDDANVRELVKIYRLALMEMDKIDPGSVRTGHR